MTQRTPEKYPEAKLIEENIEKSNFRHRLPQICPGTRFSQLAPLRHRITLRAVDALRVIRRKTKEKHEKPTSTRRGR